MLTRLKPRFEAHVDPAAILAQARDAAHEVALIGISARNLEALLKAGSPVMAHEVSRLINRAEQLRLVNRAGMRLSGLGFVVREQEMTAKAMNITAAEAMSAVRHVILQAERANHILNRKPGSYRPRASEALYGPDFRDWVPLLP